MFVDAVKMPLTFSIVFRLLLSTILCRSMEDGVCNLTLYLSSAETRARRRYKAARTRSLVPSPGTTALSSSSFLPVSVFSKGQCETVAYRFLGKRGGYAWVVTQATLIHCSKQQKPNSVVCVNYILR